MAKVYISANDATKAELMASVVRSLGHEVFSTWHEPGRSRPADADEWQTKIEGENIPEIVNSDALVVLADQYSVPGGKHIEAGFALGSGVRVIVYGAKYDNSMYNQDDVRLAESVFQLRELLARIAETPRRKRC